MEEPTFVTFPCELSFEIGESQYKDQSSFTDLLYRLESAINNALQSLPEKYCDLNPEVKVMSSVCLEEGTPKEKIGLCFNNHDKLPWFDSPENE